MRVKECERCQYEDTEACDDCEIINRYVEDELKEVLDREEKRIKG